MYLKDGKMEYPPEHVGKRTYVTVRGIPYFVPKCYCYMAGDGRYYLIDGDERPEGTNAPTVLSDMQPYRSPLDGQMVTSRSEHRAKMRQHGVIEMGNERPRYRMPEMNMPRAGHDIKRAMGKL